MRKNSGTVALTDQVRRGSRVDAAPIFNGSLTSVRCLRGYYHRYAPRAAFHWASDDPLLDWHGWVLYVPLVGSLCLDSPDGSAILDHQHLACMRFRRGVYRVTQTPDCALELIWIHCIIESDDPDLLPTICRPDDSDLIHRLALRWFQARRAVYSHSGSPLRRADVWLAAILDEIVYRSSTYRESKTGDRVIDALCASMAERPELPVDLARYAAGQGLSYSAFYKRFVAAMGEGPREHHVRLRLDAVRHRLRETNDTLETIAFATGFANRSLLTRVFSRHVGMSPTRFRQLAISES